MRKKRKEIKEEEVDDAPATSKPKLTTLDEKRTEETSEGARIS